MADRADRRARTARVKDRVRRRQARYGLDTSPRMVGRLAAAPQWCTHKHCVNARACEGPTLQEQRAPDAREVAAEATEYRDLPHYPFTAPDG